MKYETRLEQDRRVIREMNSQYRATRKAQHDVQAMVDLLLSGKGVEHVTVWTLDGRSYHRSEKT
jgi:hypothetical protein